MSTLEQKVIALTSQVLHLDPLRLRCTDSFVADLGADSIQLIVLADHFEHAFGIEAPENPATWLTTIAGAMHCIDKARRARSAGAA